MTRAICEIKNDHQALRQPMCGAMPLAPTGLLRCGLARVVQKEGWDVRCVGKSCEERHTMIGMKRSFHTPTTRMRYTTGMHISGPSMPLSL